MLKNYYDKVELIFAIIFYIVLLKNDTHALVSNTNQK